MPWSEGVHEKLARAMRRRDVRRFRELLTAFPENIRDQAGRPCWLINTAREGLVRFARVLVDEFDQDVNEVHPETKWTALMEAAAEGKARVVEWLLDHGAELADDSGYCMALECAALRGMLTVTKVLVERGVDLNAVRTGTNPLMEARKMRNTRVAKYLESAGMRPYYPTPNPAIAHPALRKAITDWYGPIGRWKVVLHEKPLVTLHVTRTGDDGTRMLFTMGLSDTRLAIDDGEVFTELLLRLPGGWQVGNRALANPCMAWPIEGLRRIVKESLAAGTWGHYHVTHFPSDEPLGPNTEMTSWACFVEDERVVYLPDERYCVPRDVVAIHESEAKFLDCWGPHDLECLFLENEVPRVLTPDRPSVVQ